MSGNKSQLHVYPENDEIEHVFDTDCACKPTVINYPHALVVNHQALDEREFVEIHTKELLAPDKGWAIEQVDRSF